MGNLCEKHTIYTINDIQHSNKLLYIVNNKVIDATNLINKHPGGNECLFTKKGYNITKDFNFHNMPSKKKY